MRRDLYRRPAAASKFVDRFRRIDRWPNAPISFAALAVVCIIVATVLGGVL